MKRKHHILLLSVTAILLFATPAFGEQLTTVGIVDMERILNEFFTQSEEVREWRQDVESFDQEREQIESEITELEEQRLEALEEDEESEALSFEEQISERRSFLDEFTRIRRNQLQQQREALLEGGDTFFSQVNSAMSFVAESEGYTVVMDAEADGMLWYTDEVDVTDEVIERLDETL
ncbi:MAG: OmpH family outer membrane protein [Spirochaetales bacterium]